MNIGIVVKPQFKRNWVRMVPWLKGKPKVLMIWILLKKVSICGFNAKIVMGYILIDDLVLMLLFNVWMGSFGHNNRTKMCNFSIFKVAFIIEVDIIVTTISNLVFLWIVSVSGINSWVGLNVFLLVSRQYWNA